MSLWFARKFEERMGVRGHENAEAADNIGVTSSAIEKWLEGGGVSRKNQQRVADYMGISVMELQAMLRAEGEPIPDLTIMRRLDATAEAVVVLAELVERLMPVAGMDDAAARLAALRRAVAASRPTPAALPPR